MGYLGDRTDAIDLQHFVAGIITGVLLHLGQLEVEALHNGRNFVHAVQVRNPHTAAVLLVSIDVAPA